MYVPTRGLGTDLTDEQQRVLQRGVELFPSCYSQQLDTCLTERGGTSFPGCDEINAAWEVEPDVMDAELDKLPYCADPELAGSRTSSLWLFVAAAGGLVVGFLAGRSK